MVAKTGRVGQALCAPGPVSAALGLSDLEARHRGRSRAAGKRRAARGHGAAAGGGLAGEPELAADRLGQDLTRIAWPGRQTE
jgi:hypothetical protein